MRDRLLLASKTIAWLFGPVIVLYEALRLFGWRSESLASPGMVYPLLASALPSLVDPSDAAVRTTVLVGAAALLLFHLSPAGQRRRLLVLMAGLQLVLVTTPAFALAFLCASAAVWAVARRTRGLTVRLAALALGAAVVFREAWRSGHVHPDLEWGLAFAFAFKGISFLVDTAEAGGPGSLSEEVSYLVGGFPCDFRGPLYARNAFSACWIERLEWEHSSEGIRRVHQGLIKILAVHLYETVAPRWLPALAMRTDWGQWMTGQELWGFGLLHFMAAFVLFNGHYQVVQGMTRLFGYAPADQMDRPWLADSPLDFWRRNVRHTVDYLFKYALFPVYRLAGSGFVAFLAVMAATTVMNLARWRNMVSDLSEGLLWAPLMMCLYWGMATILCGLALARPRGARPALGPVGRTAVVLANFVATFLMYAPASHVFGLTRLSLLRSSIPLGLVPGTNPFGMLVEVYRRLFFLD